MNPLFPPIHEPRLEGNARAFLVPWRRLPLLHLHVHLEGGVDCDPPGRDGTAALTSSLLLAGAGSRDRPHFAKALDALGAQLSIQATRTATLLSLDIPVESLSPGLELVRDVLVAPHLERLEFQKIRRRARQDWILLLENDPQALVHIAGRAWLHGRHHPEGRLEDGDDVTLARIRHADTIHFHERIVRAVRRWVVAVGDLGEEDLERAARALLDVLPAGSSSDGPMPACTPGRSPILLIDRPGSEQAYLWIGRAADATITGEDPVALDLVRSLLGGHFTSLLNRRLRIEEGLTYGAHAHVRRTRHGGWTAIATYTATETCARALDAVFTVLDSLRQQAPTDEDVEATRRYLAGQHPFGFETPSGIAHHVETIAEGLRTRRDEEDYAERLAAVPISEIGRLVERYFPRRTHGHMAVVGDAQRLLPDLAPFGDITLRPLGPGCLQGLPVEKASTRG